MDDSGNPLPTHGPPPVQSTMYHALQDRGFHDLVVRARAETLIQELNFGNPSQQWVESHCKALNYEAYLATGGKIGLKPPESWK